jgi:hypothetical protein
MTIDNNLIVEIKTVVIFVEGRESAQKIRVEFFGILKTLTKRKVIVKVISKREKLTRQLNRETKHKMTVAITLPGVKEIDDTTGKGVVGDVA